MKIDYKGKPFYLTDAQIKWVESTVGRMTTEEKVGQLFCLNVYEADKAHLKTFIEQYHMGGFMARQMSMEDIVEAVTYAQATSEIPLFVCANFEAGGDGMIKEGTNVGPCLQIGATGDPEFAEKQAYVCAREGLAVGANYAFAPVIDIDNNFRNPIMATRLFSADPAFVRDAGVAYTKTAQELGMAVSIKHFPGDGVDERDQHLVTSINSMTCEQWDKTYGEVYRACIDAGALTVMAGHIMHPAYSRHFRPGLRDEEILPATLAPELLNDLLRGKLGFNGMIVSDATTMVGFKMPLPRAKAVPRCIAAGCDMFLFSHNLQEDYAAMLAGLADGTITEERLNEAVCRILATKAALRLPEKKADGSIYPVLEEAKKIVGCREHKNIEKNCADQAVTLVKDLDHIFPLDPEMHRRVLLHTISSEQNPLGYFGGDDIDETMKTALEAEGFEVTLFEPTPGREGELPPCNGIKENYDLIIYACNLMTKSNQTVVRIEWKQPMGSDYPTYTHEVPTVFISFANPYHLIDIPRIRAYINAYRFKPENVHAVLDKMLGKSEFKGKSPVDAFCGMWDTHL